MNGLIDFVSLHPDVVVPLAIYAVGLAIIFITSRSFGMFFRDDALDLGTDLGLIAFGLLVTAGFNKASHFSATHSSNMFAAVSTYSVILFLLYAASLRFRMHVRDTVRPGGADKKAVLKWFGAFGASHALGLLAVALTWDLP